MNCSQRLSARLAAAVVLLAAAAVARPMPKLAEPDWKLYHTKDQVFQTVRQIAQSCPTTMRIDEGTHSDGNYSSTLTVVTVEPAGLSDDHSNKLRLLLNFGEHGRELISPEIGLNLLRTLCDESARNALLDRYNIPRQEVQRLLQHAVFKIIPMENVAGRERVERGEYCERKNGRGVDPNRNWDVHWGFKEKDYDPNEEYPGTKPFSEPEANLILRTAQALRPHVWASVHSGMEALFMPYDHKAQIPEGEGPKALLGILEEVNKRTCRGRCFTGSGGKSVGYLAHGTATDYMFQQLGVPVSMTWEVYGDETATFEDCIKMFNPLDAKGVNLTVDSWTAAAFMTLTLLPKHPQIQQELSLPLPGSEAAAGATGGSTTASGGAGGGASSEAEQQGGNGGVGDAGDASSADKALQIASALKEHLQQEPEAVFDAAAVAAESATGGAMAAPAGGSRRPVSTRVARRRRTMELMYWLAVVVSGVALASYLWSKPRMRYNLSKWLGNSRRRTRNIIPL